MAALGFCDPGNFLAAAASPPHPGEVEASVGILAMRGRSLPYGTDAASSTHSSPGSCGGPGLQLHTWKYIIDGIPNPSAKEPHLGNPIYLPAHDAWDATIDRDCEPPDRQNTSVRSFPKKSIPSVTSLPVLPLAILPAAANEKPEGGGGDKGAS